MLLPRFTLRTILILLTASTLVFVVVGKAVQGESWAQGVSLAFVSACVLFSFHVAWYLLVRASGRILGVKPLPPRAAVPLPAPKEPA